MAQPSVDPNAVTERGFLRVLQVSTILSLGAVAGFLYSVKEVNPHVKTEFGFGSVCAFLVMGGATWLFWRVLLNKHHLEGTSPQDRRVRTFSLVALSAFLVLGMVVATLRALQNLPKGRYLDVIEGTIMAFMVLAAISVVFYRIVRFLEEDHQRVLDQEKEHDDE